jgi:hypothetical protein
MYIVGCVLIALLATARDRRRGAVVAGVVFLVITSPFVVSISRARGHWTIGDNAKLNHVWLSNPGGYQIPNRHWQGGPPGFGNPKHPSRLVWNTPATYEFAAPIGGTFPPWTDPSYWYEGLKYRFNGAAEWRSLADNARFFDALFGRWFVLALAAALIGAGHLRSTVIMWGRNARYWGPAVAGLGLYLIGNDLLVQWSPTPQPPTRYVATFIVLLALTTAFSFRCRRATSALRFRHLLTVGLLGISAYAVAMVGGNLQNSVPPSSALPPWQISESLQHVGVVPGMRAAIVGSPSLHEFWARLARVHIIAEIEEDRAFWAEPPAIQELVMSGLSRSGVQVVVARSHDTAVERGWRVAQNTGYVVRVLTSDADADAPAGPIATSALSPTR